MQPGCADILPFYFKLAVGRVLLKDNNIQLDEGLIAHNSLALTGLAGHVANKSLAIALPTLLSLRICNRLTHGPYIDFVCVFTRREAGQRKLCQTIVP